MEDKIKITEKIVTSPETLTDSYIIAITEDSELRELYEGCAMVTSALVDIPDFDAERSLADLHVLMRAATPPRKFITRMFNNIASRKAAVAIGVILTAMVAVAAIYSIYRVTAHDSIPHATTTVTPDSAKGEEVQSFSQKNDKLYYDNAHLSHILEDVALRYDCKVQYLNPEVSDSRFHLTIPAEATLEQVAEMLNAFDEVKISIVDNTIIVQ